MKSQVVMFPPRGRGSDPTSPHRFPALHPQAGKLPRTVRQCGGLTPSESIPGASTRRNLDHLGGGELLAPSSARDPSRLSRYDKADPSVLRCQRASAQMLIGPKPVQNPRRCAMTVQCSRLIPILAMVAVFSLAGSRPSSANVLLNGDFSNGCNDWTFTDVSEPYQGSHPWATIDCSSGYADVHLHEMYGRGLQEQSFTSLRPQQLVFDYCERSG
jgi:hypothetical protein